MIEPQKSQLPEAAQMNVVYDGECPFCSNFVGLMALREAVGKVNLIDARSGDPEVCKLQRAGFDLNEGMAVVFGDQVYYGSDAVVLISGLSSTGSPMKRLTSLILREPKRAAILYPIMKFGRRITLRALGRKPIAHMLD